MRRCAAAIVTAALIATSSARAEPAPADRALATELFEQGRALIAEGKIEEACPKFAESQRLDPGPGTLLNLANCHEQEGKTATAWSEFHDALAVAEREGQSDRVAFAREHIEALSSRLARVVIVVPPELRDVDLVVARDGSSLARVVLGTAIPLDPGSHRIEVTAPGYEPWSTTFDVAAGERREIVIGPLSRAPASQPAPPPPPAPSPAPATTPKQKVLGYAAGGLGVVGLGVGAVSGILALAKTSKSESLCDPRCNDEGYSLNHAAKTAADVSTVAFIAGAVLVGIGVVLVVTSPRRDAQSALRDGVLHF